MIEELTEGTNCFFFLCILVQFHTNFSGDRTLKSTTSEEWNDGINDFLHVDAWSQKLKADQNFLGGHLPKMGVDSLVMEL